MRKQIKRISEKLFIFVVLATVLTGAVFAQKTQRKREQFDQLIRQKTQVEKTGSTKNFLAPNRVVSMNNHDSFNLGNDFAVTMFEAGDMEENEVAVNYAIVDLVYLIDSLERQPEAAQLQTILLAVVRKTFPSQQVRKDIETVIETYVSRDKSEQQWYLKAEMTVMNFSNCS